MNTTASTNSRILTIAPSSRGFGFAVFEGQEKLVDWGVKSIQWVKNTRSIEKAKKLIVNYQPGVIALEDISSPQCRRSARIQSLNQATVAFERNHKLKVTLF